MWGHKMSLSIPVTPTAKLKPRRRAELNFSGTVGAGTHLTIVSSAIPYGFRVKEAKMIFTVDANNNIRHYWLVSSEPSESTTGVPSGDNIFARENRQSYFIGKSFIRKAVTSLSYPDAPLYIKCHTWNQGAYPYVINCAINIEEL